MNRAECIVFPDIHGRDFWKEVLSGDCGWETETLVFLGDYFDPYPRDGKSDYDALINWYDMMSAVWQYPANHVFLMGNHDAHYLSDTFDRISGGCRKISSQRIPYLLRSMDLHVAFDMTVGGRRILFTHAGVMAGWYHAHEKLIGPLSADNLNQLTETDEGWEALADCDSSRGGWMPYASPLWADMRSYEADVNPVDGLGYDFQIFGHTQISDDNPMIFKYVADLDCRHPFALTPDFKLVKI